MLQSELLENLYPACAQLRAATSFSRLNHRGPWLLASHEHVTIALKDAERFRSKSPAFESAPGPEALLRTRGLVGLDHPDHTRVRRAIRGAFTPSRLQRLEGRIRDLVRARLDGRCEFDFVAELARPPPMEVILALTGLSVSALELQGWADLLTTWGSPVCPLTVDEARACAEKMQSRFAREIASRKDSDADDLIAVLAREIGDHEGAIAAHELIVFLRLLIVAGTETTTHLISNTMIALLMHSGLWKSVQENPERVSDLIEESLRFDGPVPCLIRWASADTPIGELRVKAGEAVLVLLASANHDERVFERPDEFRLKRPSRAHLSFGAGPHYCLGTTLARLQARIVFEELLNGYESIERVEDGPIERVKSLFVRGPLHLRLRGRSRLESRGGER